MADSCYEESDDESSGSEGYTSNVNSDSDSELEEVESILEPRDDPFPLDDISDVGASSTQIPYEVDISLVDGEGMPLANEEDISSLGGASEENTPINIPYKGQMFNTKETAKAFYNEYARRMGFGVRTRDSKRNKSRDNMTTRLKLVCDREGYHVPRVKEQIPGKVVIRRNTSTQKCGCMAKFIVVVRKDGIWVVTEFHEVHNHEPVTPSKQSCMKGRRHMPMAARALVETFRQCNLPVGKVVTLFDGKTVGFDARDCYNHLGKSKSYKTPIDGDATAMAAFFWKKNIEQPQFFHAILTDIGARAINFL